MFTSTVCLVVYKMRYPSGNKCHDAFGTAVRMRMKDALCVTYCVGNAMRKMALEKQNAYMH